MRGHSFKSIPRRKLRRVRFNLSHERRMTCDPFYLYPVLVDDCLPGDHWKIANEIVIRVSPMVTPIMHEINAFVHYYFVPYRLLWDQWEEFITGGRDGKFVADIPKYVKTPNTGASTESGSLWDYLGFNVVAWADKGNLRDTPVVFPHRAYNLIWNEYYRDQNLVEEVPLSYVNRATRDLHIRCWEKDYFTSMLPWQQRGDAPAFPIQGVLNMSFPSPEVNATDGIVPTFYNMQGQLSNRGFSVVGMDSSTTPSIFNTNVNAGTIFQNYLNKGTVNLQEAITFGVTELRYGFQVQKLLERLARTGSRYTEYLRGVFGEYPTDDRLNRPEYIGGSKSPVIVSEVLQTSSSDSVSPQGNMSGHGLTADRTYVSSYRVKEHGLIMGIMSIMPRSMYQQGIDRVWLKTDRFSYYVPEFAHLSEQAVYPSEIYNYVGSPNEKLGYQGRWDEYRWKRSTVHGLFRDELDIWHMGRKFSTPPELNQDLVRPSVSEITSLKRVLAYPLEPMFLVSFGNKLHVTRPLPYMSVPGMIDHSGY